MKMKINYTIKEAVQDFEESIINLCIEKLKLPKDSDLQNALNRYTRDKDKLLFFME